MSQLRSPALAALLLLGGCAAEQPARPDPGAGAGAGAAAAPAPAPVASAAAAPAAAAAAASAAPAPAKPPTAIPSVSVGPDAGQDPVDEPGFVALFNGRDLAGWEGNPAVWRVVDHVIVGGSLQGNPRNEFLASAASYTDFVFKCEYKLTPRASSTAACSCAASAPSSRPTR